MTERGKKNSGGWSIYKIILLILILFLVALGINLYSSIKQSETCFDLREAAVYQKEDCSDLCSKLFRDITNNVNCYTSCVSEVIHCQAMGELPKEGEV